MYKNIIYCFCILIFIIILYKIIEIINVKTYFGNDNKLLGYTLHFNKIKNNTDIKHISNFDSNKSIKKWYIVTSKKYTDYYNYVKDKLQFYHKNISFEPINLDQDILTKHFTDSVKKYPSYYNRWLGCNEKIKKIIPIIEKNLNNYIIISDIDIFVKKDLSDYFNYYISKNKDIYLLDPIAPILLNYINIKGHNYTISLMIINCNTKVLNMFKDILNNIDNNTWDEKLLNIYLDKHKLTHEKLCPEKFIVTDSIKDKRIKNADLVKIVKILKDIDKFSIIKELYNLHS